MAGKTLQEQFAELRSKSLRAANNSENALRKQYKTLMQDLNHFIADEYAALSEDGELSYAILQQKAEYARFLEEVTECLDDITPQITAEIQKLVNKTYELSYTGLVEAISTAKDLPSLATELASVKASTATAIKRAVENPIAKLTLKDTLEHKRHEITYNIRKQISIGLANGDRYETMAKRIATTLDGDYKKALTVARTEAHKVREQGFSDAALDCNEAIKKGKSGLISVKIWRTGKDQRVRDSHVAMEGKMVLVDEMFELPSGATTMTPGDSGNAAEDINCRCYLSYKLLTREEYEKATGKKIETANKADDMQGSPKQEATDFDSLEKEMKEKYGEQVAITDGVKQLDFDSVREAEKGVDAVLSEFPKAKEYFKGFGTSGYVGTSEIMEAGYSGKIYLVDKHFSSYSSAQAITEKAKGLGKSVYHVGMHEAGHILDVAYTRICGGDSMDFDKREFSKKIINEAKRNVKKATGKTVALDSISNYSGTNTAECLAEAVVEHFFRKPEKQTDLGKAIWDILKRELG